MKESLADPPTSAELAKALKQSSPGKAPGVDGIPADIYKNGGDVLLGQLTSLFRPTWEAGQVQQDFMDASIVHIYKRKGDKTSCDNHHGISLLYIVGKIVARAIPNRLITHIADSIVSESQYEFRAGRDTSNMVLAVRQLREKCCEQNQELHLVFVDLTKAFNTEDRSGLWKILQKSGCPDKFRTDGKLFNLQRLQAKTKVFEATQREFLFAEDCALVPHSHKAMQYITDRFEAACRPFGLTISLGKTEAMFQPSPS